MKKCNRCGKEFPASSVYWRVKSSATGRLSTACKPCLKVQDAYYRKKNAESIKIQREVHASKPEVKTRNAELAKARKSPWNNYINFELRLCRHYNIDVTTYLEMQDNQKGCCAICSNSLYHSGSKRNAHIDHNHETGKVRAILCSHCNHTVGYSLEDINRLRAIVVYLEKHNG